MSLTKSDISRVVAETAGTSKKDAQELVEAVFGIMKETLEGGEDVKVAGFGKWCVRKKQARRGRNPQTGEKIVIDTRHVTTFKPSEILKSKVNLLPHQGQNKKGAPAQSKDPFFSPCATQEQIV